MKRAGLGVPLWVSHKAALERLGPLGAAWREPGRWKPSTTLLNGLSVDW